jgi:hypothetical protein
MGLEMAKTDPDRNKGGENASDVLKVNDRRMFTKEGDLREEMVDSDSDAEGNDEQGSGVAEATAERTTATEQSTVVPETQAEAEFQRRPLEEPEGVDFMMLINAMAQPAWIFLGEAAHPGSGKPEVNLEQARLQIDLLDILRIKCRGNMTAEEEGLLDRLLYQLRMLFVARSGAQGS